jgi:polo-like kinase 4
LQDQPPDIPLDGADHIYSYESLPQEHWKKYLYAHRFVQMVRGKTPKVTFYSDLAKCQLMETLEDFEMEFYKGGLSVSKAGIAGDFKLPNEKILSLNERQNVLQHAEQCLMHCIQIERTLSMVNYEQPCFPVIIGRRPEELKSTREVLQDNTFNNYISSSQTPLRTPRIQMPSFSVDQTPSPCSVKPFSSSSSSTSYRFPDSPITPNNFPQKNIIPGESPLAKSISESNLITELQ